MKSQIAVPIPTEQFVELVNFLREEKDIRDPVEVVSYAIEYFLNNAAHKQDDLLVTRSSHGYQWKNLYLPDKTQIRMQYKGRYFYATVERDEIIFERTPISPGSLANKIAGSSRNAWRDLWIKRPEDKEWKLADDCRRDAEDIDPDEAMKDFLSTSNTLRASNDDNNISR
ncbi:MAG: hypothetical protein H0U23_08105 [Blastocatellia bacterium]|nr:hypothetical protein [Blastocatellia bacterium]